MSQNQETPDNIQSAIVSSGGGRKFLGGLLHNPKMLLSRSRLLPVLIIIAVLAVGGGLLYRYHRDNQKTQHAAAESKAFANSQLQQQLAIGQQAQTMSNNGQYADAQKLLDLSIARTSDKARKADLYIDKASIALTASNNNDALSFAQQSEKLYPTLSSASMIAEIADAMGNKTLALQYYKLELQRIGTPKDDYTIPSLKAKIKALGG